MTNSITPPSHSSDPAVAVPAAALVAQAWQALLVAALAAVLLVRMAMKGREAALRGLPFMRIMATLLPLAMCTILWEHIRGSQQQGCDAAGIVFRALVVL